MGQSRLGAYHSIRRRWKLGAVTSLLYHFSAIAEPGNLLEGPLWPISHPRLAVRNLPIHGPIRIQLEELSGLIPAAGACPDQREDTRVRGKKITLSVRCPLWSPCGKIGTLAVCQVYVSLSFVHVRPLMGSDALMGIDSANPGVSYPARRTFGSPLALRICRHVSSAHLFAPQKNGYANNFHTCWIGHKYGTP